MNGPRRLRESGGVSERLLDSASIDRPKQAARARALELAATAGAFVTTTAGGAAAARSSAPPTLHKSVAMWICVGAFAGGMLALIASSIFDYSSDSGSAAARAPATLLVVPEPPVAAVMPPSDAANGNDIAAEPPLAAASAKSPVSAKSRALTAPPQISPAEPVALPPPVAPHAPLSEREKEAGALAIAREAFASGDSAAAIRALDAYDSTHPNGSLKAESAALRDQAVSNKSRARAPTSKQSTNGGVKAPSTSQ